MSGISMFDLEYPDAIRRPCRLVERENDRKKIRQRDQERLEPVVKHLAWRRGAEGITASELITEATAIGIFTGQEWRVAGAQRAYSWIGPWLAQLARRGTLAPLVRGGVQQRRRSEREHSHGNSQNIYVSPEFAEASDG